MKIPLIVLAGQERQNNNSNNKLSLQAVLFGSVVSFFFYLICVPVPAES